MSQTQNNSADNKPIDNSELISRYIDADSIDQEVFAEMRSNILLVSGEHYNRRQSNFYKRIRDSKEISNEQKLRLTKNHTQNICKKYVNNIMAHQPGVGFSPRLEDDILNQKITEYHKKIWQDAKQKYSLDERQDDWCDDFVEIGEVNVKIFYDPNGGSIKGFNPLIDEETGEVQTNEFQQPMPDNASPVFEGAFVFEDVYGFNLLRPQECKDMRQAEWLCIRKMADIKALKAKVQDEDKQKYITASTDETYLVFDGSRGAYRKTRNQTMLREFYDRPCAAYPMGQFYIATKEGIIEQGDLPGGIFPIVTALFDRIQTTPRGRSPIKQIRPYQAEINRSASKMAEHQITLGDDKLLIPNGGKASAGLSLPGIRQVNISGGTPTVLPGRSGEQYLQYMESQISELYAVMGVADEEVEDNQNVDPHTLLYRSGQKKLKFNRWIKRFEKFLIELSKLYLRLAKIHMTDEDLLKILGEGERANLQAFRDSDDLSFNVNIEAQADDIETKFGKQMSINHVLQYVGGQLKPDDIGKMIREMPYANMESSFDDLTLDYDLAVNDILALDRGESPPVAENDNHDYLMKKLAFRMRKTDFKYLSPQIQQTYAAKLQVHQQFKAQQALAIQRAESGFIPSGGYSVSCQMYVQDPSDPTGKKTMPVRVPYMALQWLVQQLQAQGQGQAELAQMDSSNQAAIANQVSAAQHPPMMPNLQRPPMGMPGGPPHGLNLHPQMPGQAPGMSMGTAMPRRM